MTIKIAMNILTLSCYVCKEFLALPTSGMGSASTHVNRIQKSPFCALLWQPTAQDRRLAVASNVGSVK